MGFVKTPDEMRRLMSVREQPEFHDAEMLFVFWETKPEIVARLLPPPLEPTPDPLACALVAHYPRTNFGPPYHEGALCLRAQYGGVPGNYCIAMPVTVEWADAVVSKPACETDPWHEVEVVRLPGGNQRTASNLQHMDAA